MYAICGADAIASRWTGSRDICTRQDGRIGKSNPEGVVRVKKAQKYRKYRQSKNPEGSKGMARTKDKTKFVTTRFIK